MKLYGGDHSDVDAPQVKQAWERLTGERLDREIYSYIFGVSDNQVKAILLYWDYTKYSITLHMYAPKALNRMLISVGLQYPFVDLKVTKLYSEFNIKKENSRRCLEKVGFKYIALIEDFYGKNEDKVVMAATIEDVAGWLE
jgi:hypothetical protein